MLKDGFYHPLVYWPKEIKKSLPYGIKNTYATDHAIKRMSDRGVQLTKNIDLKDWKVTEAEVRGGKLHGIRVRTKKPDHNNEHLVITVVIDDNRLLIISVWKKDASDINFLNSSYIKG